MSTAAATAPDDPHAAALAYAARGWRVLPITPGKKHPPITAWQEAATTDPAVITSWFTGLYRTHGVGIATGAASGIFVLDVDDIDALRDLEHAHEALPETLTSLTGSGGHHLIYAYPTDGTRITNSNRLPAGLDTRGEGGQIVAPPTVHPNGTRYEWDAGTEHLDPAPAPAWLLELVTVTDEPVRRATPSPRTDLTEGRPGDRWAEVNDWADILAPDGWVLDKTDRKGERYWVRPGKDPREGHSATTGWSSADNLKLFTSSLSHWGLVEEETYTKLGYLATVHFGGDMSAAASWLREQGWGDESIALDTLLTDPAAELPPAPPVEPEEWPEPTLPADHATPPPFPLHALPRWAQDHAAAVAEQVQVPVDLAAMLTIGALSAACTGRATVAVSPNWHEPVNLYLVTAMRSGSGKSAAEKLCCSWLREWQADRIEAAMPAWEEARQRLRLAERHLKKAEDGSNLDNEALLALHARNEAKEAMPQLPRILADDATPEAVATLLAAHGERLAIISTEADLFDMVLKGKTGQRASMNVYLKAWSGDPMIRDRKGGTETGPESTTLKRPLMTVSITVQPSVLARVNGDEEMVSRGFAARFMFALPPDLIGQRDQRRRFSTQRLTTAEPYERHAVALAEQWSSWLHPPLVHLSEDAAAVLEDFLVEIEPQLAAGAEYERLGEWVNKLHGSIARYSGLLHLAEGHDASTPIDAATMARAIDLGRYWLATAVIVMTMADDPTDQALVLLEWMAEQGLAEFKLRDIQKGVRRPGLGLDKAVDYVPALELLVEHGWIKPSVEGWRDSVGVQRRESGYFSLWPECIGQPQRVVNARKARCASKGERVLSSSPLPPLENPTPTPPPHAQRALRAYSDQPTPPVDNSDDLNDLF